MIDEIKLKDILIKLEKSSIKAGEGKSTGNYPLYTCSSMLNKYYDDYLYDEEAIIVGTGGSPAINYCNGKFCASTDCWTFISNDKYEVKYIYYLLLSKINELQKMFRGAGLKHLNREEFMNIQVKTLDTEDQNNIINKLDRIQEIIGIRKKQIEELDVLVKARFVELFDLERCERKSLGECTDFVDYRGHTPELSDEGTIRMVNAKSVGKGFFKYVNEYITEETYNSWMHRGFGYAGDILFVTEGHTFGNTCLIPDDMTKFALGQRVITIKGHKEIYNAFLCSYMQTDMFWQDINVYRTGGTAQGIRSKDLMKVTVPIPSLELQKKFVRFVKQTDKSKLKLQKSLDEMQNLFDSLMAEYFG